PPRRGGRRMEANHRGRAPRGRQDLRPTLARRTRLASGFSRRRAPRRSLRVAVGGEAFTSRGRTKLGAPRDYTNSGTWAASRIRIFTTARSPSLPPRCRGGRSVHVAGTHQAGDAA